MHENTAEEHGFRDHRRDATWVISRRDFLKVLGGTAAGLSTSALAVAAGDDPAAAPFRFGMLTDSHYADRDRQGTRHYRESVAKMRECVQRMNQENVANTNIARNANYYSFDRRGLHFIVLDANYRGDGVDYDSGNFQWTDANVPPAELNWLKRDLASTRKPSIVFIHQQLDGAGAHYVKNAADVRRILQKHGNVLAVFQGHNHAGHYSLIEGIHYYTLRAMVEGTGEKNSSYAIVEIHDDLGITVTGYRRALSRKLGL